MPRHHPCQAGLAVPPRGVEHDRLAGDGIAPHRTLLVLPVCQILLAGNGPAVDERILLDCHKYCIVLLVVQFYSLAVGRTGRGVARLSVHPSWTPYRIATTARRAPAGSSP